MVPICVSRKSKYRNKLDEPHLNVVGFERDGLPLEWLHAESGSHVSVRIDAALLSRRASAIHGHGSMRGEGKEVMLVSLTFL